MPNFNLNRDIVQTNKYLFVVVADNEAEANKKLDEYLESQSPMLYSYSEDKSIGCYDREADV